MPPTRAVATNDRAKSHATPVAAVSSEDRAGRDDGIGPARSDRAAELEADAHRLIARGHELLAEAARFRTPAAEPASTLVPLHHAASLAATSLRVLREAIRSGELPAYGGQRDRAVRMGDLTRWIESRRVVLEGPADRDIDRRMRRLARRRKAGGA